MLADKQKIRAILLESRYDDLGKMVKEKKSRFSTLMSLSYTTDPSLKWHVVKAAGKVAALLCEQDEKFIRTNISNLLWSLNDDSGSVGWASPELLGEIISMRIDLFKEYIPLIISLLKIKETFFRPGVLWAMGRIAIVDPASIKPFAPYLNMYLADPLPETRGYAVWCLGQIGATVPEEHLLRLLSDASEVLLLDRNGSISKKTIGEITKEASTGNMQ